MLKNQLSMLGIFKYDSPHDLENVNLPRLNKNRQFGPFEFVEPKFSKHSNRIIVKRLLDHSKLGIDDLLNDYLKT